MFALLLSLLGAAVFAAVMRWREGERARVRSAAVEFLARIRAVMPKVP
jgi:hypothetical protein